MADNEKKSTSFIQFKYCGLCKISHKHKNKKHVYSSRHQEIIKGILLKLKKRIDEAKAFLKNPQVMNLGWEKEASVWCYFCGKSINKHTSHDEYIVTCGQFLQHLTLQEHVQKMNDFFWENIIDKKKKSHYVITDKELKKFQQKLEEAVDKFKIEQKSHLLKVAEKLKQKELRQNYLSHQYQTQYQYDKPIRQINPQTSASDDDNRDVERLINAPRTNSFGLTIIQRPKGNKEKGNIFTGAAPPWLQHSTDDINRQDIGPTLSDYEKHLKLEKKKKLPENRVGANFNRHSVASASWLPSFGGVWSHQRRLNNKNQFQRKMNYGSDKILDSIETIDPQKIKPYVRKRSATVTSGIDSSLSLTTTSFNETLTNTVNDTVPNNSQPNSTFTSVKRSSEIPQTIIPYKRTKKDTESKLIDQYECHPVSSPTTKGNNSVITLPLACVEKTNFLPNYSLPVHPKISKSSQYNPYNIKLPFT
ncbi:centrosomal AT-AC splicing factor [Patella vulgata]|uniref:centrosomal AT-AC splicing factor n=1 Tax=Patella vulgata TaxID=6465 RepID=UPI0021807754|nr:centrosomal AT-AC splicing factor [Patella vulgata]